MSVKEPAPLSALVTEGAWNVYCVSPMYKFSHDAATLSADAMELVAYLRCNLAGELKANQTVTASVRSQGDVALFAITETLVSGPRRLGGFIYYTPDVPGTKKRTDVLLLQGNEDLLALICAWLQHQYQCVVALHAVSVNSVSMEAFAYNLYHIMLEANDNVEHAPLRLTLHCESVGKSVQSVTISVPWRDLCASHRALTHSHSSASENTTRRTTVVGTGSESGASAFSFSNFESNSDLDRFIRGFIAKYVAQLPVEMSSYRLFSVSSEDCILENMGRLQFYTAESVPAVLDAMLQLFVAQSVLCPEAPETTF